jgi:hypothetical protein
MEDVKNRLIMPLMQQLISPALRGAPDALIYSVDGVN